MQKIGKTPRELEEAIASRDVISSKNYEASYGQPMSINDDLTKIMQNPYFKDEIARADKLVEASNASRVVAGLAPRNSLTERLHFVKEGLDSTAQSVTVTGAPAISGSTKSAVTSVKKELVKWLGDNNALYDKARLEHIVLSKPINQMRVGQELAASLSAPATGAERAAAFAGKVRSFETNISKSTGAPRLASLTPEQIRVIRSIEKDFARNANYKELARAGSGTSLERRIGAPTVPPTGLFAPMIAAARSWANTSLGTGYENALERLAPIMADPQKVAQLMRDATPAQREIIDAALARYMTAGGISASQDSGMMRGER